MGYRKTMAIAHSRLTSQGQISVPAKIRKKLGMGPGSILEWVEDDGRIIVRKAGRYTSQEIHEELFDVAPDKKSDAELRDGIRQRMKRRHARD